MSELPPEGSRRAARDAPQPTATFPAMMARTKQPPVEQPPPDGPRITRLQRGLIIGASALIFVLLATGSVFFGISVGRNAASRVPVPQPTTATRATPASQVQPTAIPTCSLDTLASAPALMKLYGSVVETATGDSLYSNNDTTAQRPASVLKVLTASAAIAVLGPTYQITTSVVEVEPGTIALIGQGDATLSSTGHNVYAGAATLSSLATNTITAYNANSANAGVPITHLILDSTYWDPSDNWDSSVPRTEQTGGYLSESTALQVDGDRANPGTQVSPRSTDPVGHAGTAFIAALVAATNGPDAGTVTAVKQATPSGATPLATAKSQPVSTLIKQMLATSDNTLAEMLARIVSVKQSLGGTGDSIGQSTLKALATFGLDTTGLTIQDGSGESDESLIPPVFMSKFMSLVSQKANGLQYVAAGVPVVGKYSAKAGVIASAYTLSGYTTAADGTGESFTFFAEGSGITSAAQPALAALANAVYTCGKNITNY